MYKKYGSGSSGSSAVSTENTRSTTEPIELDSDDLAFNSGGEITEDDVMVRENFDKIFQERKRMLDNNLSTNTSVSTVSNREVSIDDPFQSSSSRSRSLASKRSSRSRSSSRTPEWHNLRSVDCDYVLELGGANGAGVLRKGQSTSPAKEAYLGFMTRSDAEKKMSKSCTFALYHPLLPPKELAFSVVTNLNIVYRTANGTFRHYAIDRETASERAWFRVRCGADAPRFPSLDSLVKFYKVYVMFSDTHGERNVEVLPPPRDSRNLCLIQQE